MKTLALVAAVLSLVACANPSATGNENFVTVNTGYFDEARALPMADAHCHKYGKSARYTRMDGLRFSYDCI